MEEDFLQGNNTINITTAIIISSNVGQSIAGQLAIKGASSYAKYNPPTKGKNKRKFNKVVIEALFILGMNFALINLPSMGYSIGDV